MGLGGGFVLLPKCRRKEQHLSAESGQEARASRDPPESYRRQEPLHDEYDKQGVLDFSLCRLVPPWNMGRF